MMQRTTFTALALVAVAALAGCSATAPAGAAPDAAATSAANAPADATHAQVQARSDAYWKARRSADVATAYSLTSPGYRAVNSLEQFQLDYGAIPNLTGGDVVSIQCEGQRCKLTRSFFTSTALMPGAQVPISIDEIWVQQDGLWWIFIQ